MFLSGLFSFLGISLDEYLSIRRVVIPIKEADEQFTLYRIASNTVGSKKLLKIDNEWAKYFDVEEEKKYKISGSIIRPASDSDMRGVYRSGDGCITWHKRISSSETQFSKTPFEIWAKYGW